MRNRRSAARRLCDMGVECLIALGGNLGKVRDSFSTARISLAALPTCRIAASSGLYRSRAIGPPGQPDYLNAVLLLETEMPPLALLSQMQNIELQHGRIRGEKWGARTLDLDIVDYNGQCLSSTFLTLPHPRMHERLFVLQPLCDIHPGWQHPQLDKTAAELLAALLARGETRLPEGEAW